MNVKGKKIVTACQTRWNTSFQMLDRLLKLKWPVTAVLPDENITKRSDRSIDLRSEQWSLAEKLVKILKPFNVVTTFFSYEENVSTSSILPVLLDHLKAPGSDDEADFMAICQFKEGVSFQIKRRWKLDVLDVSSPLLLSSFFDPHFKHCVLSKLKDDDAKYLKEKIIEYMEALDNTHRCEN